MTDDSNQRANGQFTGVVPLEVVAKEGGLSVMRGILEGRLPGAAMAKTLNFWLTTVEEGLIVFTGTPNVDHLNPLGTIHGYYHGRSTCLRGDDDAQTRRGLHDGGVQA